MRVYIKTSTGMGRTYDLDVHPSTTLRQLKTRFLERTNNKQDGQQLRFLLNDEILDDDDRMLRDHDIEEESILQVIDVSRTGRNQFAGLGAKFVDVGNGKGVKKVNWAEKGPEWCAVAPGLSLEGICTNDQCAAHELLVVMSMGFRKYDVLLDDDEDATKCPLCQKYVKPTICGFNRCWWRFEGKKEDSAGGPPKKCSSDWQQVGDDYRYFDPDTSGEVVWRQLIIEAVKNKPSK